MRIESKNYEISSLKPHTLNRCSHPLGPAQRCLRVLYPTLRARAPTRAGPQAAPAPANYEPVCPPEISSCPLDPAVNVVPGSIREMLAVNLIARGESRRISSN